MWYFKIWLVIFEWMIVDKAVHAFSISLNIRNLVRSSILKQQTSTNEISILEQFDFSSEFNRWRFLKDFLDEEESIEGRHVNHLLYVVLKSFYDNPRPLKLTDGATNPSPILSLEQRSILEKDLFQMKHGVNTIEVFADESMGGNEDILKLLEVFQPSETEDEDAFKSAWDLVVLMYGVEATKQAQQNRDINFNVRSFVVRLLLHYDFLVAGI